MTHFWSLQKNLIEFFYMALSRASLKNKFPSFNVNVNPCELFLKDDSYAATQHNDDSPGGWAKHVAGLTLFISTNVNAGVFLMPGIVCAVHFQVFCILNK